MSIEAVFTGRHETFQYTKVATAMAHATRHSFLILLFFFFFCYLVYTRFDLNHSQMKVRCCADMCPVAKRLQCVNSIDPGQIIHSGGHIHSNEEQPFHFCEERYVPSYHIMTNEGTEAM